MRFAQFHALAVVYVATFCVSTSAFAQEAEYGDPYLSDISLSEVGFRGLDEDVSPVPAGIEARNASYPSAISGTCDDGSCESDCCGPEWKVSGEFLYLQRDNKFLFLQRDQQSETRIINGAASGIDVDTRRVDFDFEPGFAVALERTDCDSFVQVRYSQVESWSDTADIAGIQISDEINLETVVVIGATPASIQLVQDTDFHSVEANFGRITCRGWRLMAGVRWFNLNDDFLLDANYGGGVYDRFGFNAQNHLVGFQLGAEKTIANIGSLEVNWFSKAGLYANFAEIEVTRESVGLSSRDSVDDTVPAFVGELGIMGRVPLGDCWSLSGGYQVAWVTGVALGVEHFTKATVDGSNNLLISQLSQDDVFFHGARVAIDKRW